MSTTTKQHWPTKAVMNQIYDLKLWGGKTFDFYSGEGSHNAEIVKPYIDTIHKFLKSHDSNLTVCDLGCGDFNIGKQLTKHTKTYIAIDIVESLITRNKRVFKADNLEFLCLDITKDELPKTDVIILRQVLQHLSNSEIIRTIEKLADYKYIILTEHLPAGDFLANKDIITGQGIRLKHNSGVNLQQAPFNLEFNAKRTLLEHILDHNKGKIVTTLYESL